MTIERYSVGFYKTYEAAMDALESMFAAGDVVEGERPQIEHIRANKAHPYSITLGYVIEVM